MRDDPTTPVTLNEQQQDTWDCDSICSDDFNAPELQSSQSERAPFTETPSQHNHQARDNTDSEILDIGMVEEKAGNTQSELSDVDLMNIDDTDFELSIVPEDSESPNCQSSKDSTRTKSATEINGMT